MSKHVGIYLFADVEVLDFAGPFEVFTTASRVHKRLHPDRVEPFRTFSVARTPGPVHARAGLRIVPDHRIDDHPDIDVLIVPGGVVAAELLEPDVLRWISRQSASCELVASVCTGAFILAHAGVVRGGRVTTHWEDQAELAASFPALDVVDGPRWIDQGKVVTSAGISAGIDMSLHLVGRLVSPALAQATARQMDYAWHAAAADRMS
jgi:transcriptional regulator GlxA family with amidase domain